MRLSLRTYAVLASLSVCFAAGGCSRAINAMTDTPEFRKGVVEKARNSCMTSANQSIKIEKTPQVEAELTDYCNCFADKGLGMLSNADLVEIGVKGIDRMSPDQKAKFDGAVKMCQAQAFHR